MSIFKRFYPDFYSKTTYSIDFEKLYDRGYRGIIFDIDNTLVPDGAPADQHATELFQKLRALGFQTRLVSNNKEPRVKSFADVVGSAYVFRAKKPGTQGYLQAIANMDLKKEQVIVIGDQFFSDIWGAKRSGLCSIMVERIGKAEPPEVRLKRVFELPVRIAYFRKHCKTDYSLNV